jgi:hypothetical protein
VEPWDFSWFAALHSAPFPRGKPIMAFVLIFVKDDPTTLSTAIVNGKRHSSRAIAKSE